MTIQPRLLHTSILYTSKRSAEARIRITESTTDNALINASTDEGSLNLRKNTRGGSCSAEAGGTAVVTYQREAKRPLLRTPEMSVGANVLAVSSGDVVKRGRGGKRGGRGRRMRTSRSRRSFTDATEVPSAAQRGREDVAISVDSRLVNRAASSFLLDSTTQAPSRPSRYTTP